jgi:hypothetical protein
LSLKRTRSGLTAPLRSLDLLNDSWRKRMVSAVGD